MKGADDAPWDEVFAGLRQCRRKSSKEDIHAGSGDAHRRRRRVEERADPRIIEPTDAIIRLAATCICGSDLWPYRGVEPADH